ncbi:DMT family transporter [Ruixingdingia sedimenti]|uniref:DMT family transporter n=1 Tax=Ruixingdingia sedimenti TaxID=3073604 RepID=A0ABU1FDC5_9RHOB|nr:DMT family transporter [Xinfangfangia sp. LG-4]MDR5654847.1 DMT family transporter [Xinfangfangia sp. LG-4]
MPAPNLKGALLALLSFGIYASHDAVVKALGGTYTAFQIVFFSVVLAFPLAVLLALSEGRNIRLRPRNPGLMAIRCAAVVTSALCAFYSFTVLPLAQTYALLFTMPLFITLLAMPVLGERVGARRLAAVAVGFCGVLVVLRPGQVDLGPGHLSALASAGAAAVNSVITRRISAQESRATMLIFPMLAQFGATAVALPFVYVPVAGADLVLMGLVAAGAFLGMLAMITAFRFAEALVVAPMHYSQILWAVFYGYVFFHETPHTLTFLGAAIIIGSGLYILLREGRPSVSATRPVSHATPAPAPPAPPVAEPPRNDQAP